MKGYIYKMFAGADPGHNWVMTDPIFGKAPTLGACMPNIRRVVERGDYIFTISGKVEGIQPYIVGGFRVADKIDALAAYRRFPENRMKLKDGELRGNIIVDSKGKKHPLDYHGSFEKRVENYIVGEDPIFLKRPEVIEKARKETLKFLAYLFNKRGKSVFEIIGRWRKMDQEQIKEIKAWLRQMEKGA